MKKQIIAIFQFYRDGFREMTWGRTLWWLILVKLFVIFVILKLFFFPSFLKGKTEQEKQEYVGTELIDRALEESKEIH
ncbi:DUF4492 domain-containing protein [Phocaeicola barnesiae]|jgi:uncharacterized membrane protein|uniref:DUF4492 domain-containing protein n=1 Tax=Phocaeicola barnesiae TaxID=376804 RepID=UPI001E05AB2E|nr:DUF4492 domain-containing protein [Phocaeicola barnesiae]MBS6467918.1 DUF4492 domain-containing protein [Bacteroides sp.]MCF2575808.1 DUF4492 domain-containing protein [Phocaeicola barnesiae]HJG76377.1 DUF4492 domain-containing protein [Phocaeicola barnesiae]